MYGQLTQKNIKSPQQNKFVQNTRSESLKITNTVD